MKLHPYELQNPDFNLDLYIESSRIMKKLNKKYNTNNFLYKQNNLMEILKYGEPKGKNISDLGCGTVNSPDNHFGTKLFEPWLDRALSEMGANVIGIDKHASLKEILFTEYRLDLTKNNSLDFLKNKSIDLVCMNSFLDAPSLYMNSKKIMKILFPQLKRIVKNNGVFIYENFGFNQLDLK